MSKGLNFHCNYVFPEKKKNKKTPLTSSDDNNNNNTLNDDITEHAFKLIVTNPR